MVWFLARLDRLDLAYLAAHVFLPRAARRLIANSAPMSRVRGNVSMALPKLRHKNDRADFGRPARFGWRAMPDVRCCVPARGNDREHVDRLAAVLLGIPGRLPCTIR